MVSVILLAQEFCKNVDRMELKDLWPNVSSLPRTSLLLIFLFFSLYLPFNDFFFILDVAVLILEPPFVVDYKPFKYLSWPPCRVGFLLTVWHSLFPHFVCDHLKELVFNFSHVPPDVFCGHRVYQRDFLILDKDFAIPPRTRSFVRDTSTRTSLPVTLVL